jgi:hypothetical protein
MRGASIIRAMSSKVGGGTSLVIYIAEKGQGTECFGFLDSKNADDKERTHL